MNKLLYLLITALLLNTAYSAQNIEKGKANINNNSNSSDYQEALQAKKQKQITEGLPTEKNIIYYSSQQTDALIHFAAVMSNNLQQQKGFFTAITPFTDKNTRFTQVDSKTKGYVDIPFTSWEELNSDSHYLEIDTLKGLPNITVSVYFSEPLVINSQDRAAQSLTIILDNTLTSQASVRLPRKQFEQRLEVQPAILGVTVSEKTDDLEELHYTYKSKAVIDGRRYALRLSYPYKVKRTDFKKHDLPSVDYIETADVKSINIELM